MRDYYDFQGRLHIHIGCSQRRHRRWHLATALNGPLRKRLLVYSIIAINVLLLSSYGFIGGIGNSRKMAMES